MENALDLRWKGDTGGVETVDWDLFLARKHPRNKTYNVTLHPSMLQLSHLYSNSNKTFQFHQQWVNTLACVPSKAEPNAGLESRWFPWKIVPERRSDRVGRMRQSRRKIIMKNFRNELLHTISNLNPSPQNDPELCLWRRGRSEVKVAQSCLTLCDQMGYTVHRILQAKILQNTGVGSCSLLQGIFPTRDQTQVSHIAGRFFTSWAREVQEYWSG